MSKLIFILVAAWLVTYCGYQFAQAVLYVHDRVAQEIARVGQ